MMMMIQIWALATPNSLYDSGKLFPVWNLSFSLRWGLNPKDLWGPSSPNMLWQWPVGQRCTGWLLTESKPPTQGSKDPGTNWGTGAVGEELEYKPMHTRAFLRERVQNYQRGLGLKGSEDPDLGDFSSSENAQGRDHLTQSAPSLPAPSKSEPPDPGTRRSGLVSRPLSPGQRFTCSQALACGSLNTSVPTLGEHGPAGLHGRRHVGTTTTLLIAAATDTDRRGGVPPSLRLPTAQGAGLSPRPLQAPPPEHRDQPPPPTPRKPFLPFDSVVPHGSPLDTWGVELLSIAADVWEPSVLRPQNKLSGGWYKEHWRSPEVRFKSQLQSPTGLGQVSQSLGTFWATCWLKRLLLPHSVIF